MVSENSKASISFTITEVESIPCDLRGQTVIFDAEANLLSDPVKTPWAMPWVMDEISKLADGRTEIPEEQNFRVYNSEESDQYIELEVKRF